MMLNFKKYKFNTPLLLAFTILMIAFHIISIVFQEPYIYDSDQGIIDILFYYSAEILQFPFFFLGTTFELPEMPIIYLILMSLFLLLNAMFYGFIIERFFSWRRNRKR
jgi:hypothetical protein